MVVKKIKRRAISGGTILLNTLPKPSLVNARTYVFAVYDTLEQYSPGFKASIIGQYVLTPPDLERIFGLTGGVSYN